MALLRKEEVERVAPQPRAPDVGAVLGRGTRFEGKLTFEGTVRIDGEFIGEVVSEGCLVVGEGARVDGAVRVDSAVVSGQVEGKVHTGGALELKSTAKVTGDLVVATLVIERGAQFEGSVKMSGSDPTASHRSTRREAAPGTT